MYTSLHAFPVVNVLERTLPSSKLCLSTCGIRTPTTIIIYERKHIDYTIS